MIHHGDCIEVMAAMEPESVDAIVTDPPYGLEFMGKEWDRLFDKRKSGGMKSGMGSLPGPTYIGGTQAQAWHQQWAEAAYRVAKPSSYLLAFGGTRTVHRMTVALEDAGWIIRDMLVWAYASGFPKSKASLKPAWEPIVMARKPGPLRMLAIDECRIPFQSSSDAAAAAAAAAGYAESLRNGRVAQSVAIGKESRDGTEYEGPDQRGRWPANVILTDPIFDGGWEGVVGGGEQSGGGNPRWRSNEAAAGSYGGFAGGETGLTPIDTEGTYSRFFLIPKASRSDREPVLGGLPLGDLRTMGDGAGEWSKHGPGAIQRQNVHPTVKPTELMRHLVRLVTPRDGVVLDPFLGSGTTALAAEMEGFAWIGIEREPEYVAIAEARLNGTQRGLGLGA